MAATSSAATAPAVDQATSPVAINERSVNATPTAAAAAAARGSRASRRRDRAARPTATSASGRVSRIMSAEREAAIVPRSVSMTQASSASPGSMPRIRSPTRAPMRRCGPFGQHLGEDRPIQVSGDPGRRYITDRLHDGWEGHCDRAHDEGQGEPSLERDPPMPAWR